MITNPFSIEARSFNILNAGVASHNFWVLKNAAGEKIAELHGLATERASGRPLPVGTTKQHSLRAWSFVEPDWVAAIGVDNSSPAFKKSNLYLPGQRQKVLFQGAAQEAYARWQAAGRALAVINALDLDYPPFGVAVFGKTVNSNSMFRTFRKLMGLPHHCFSGMLQPGISNDVLPREAIERLKYSASAPSEMAPLVQ